jgi:unsaturated rhamnogalacturonyl hydrolase
MRATLSLALAGASSAAAAGALPPPASILSVIENVTLAFMSNNTPGDCHWERATYFFGHTEGLLLTNSTQALDFALAWADGNSWMCDGAGDPPNDTGGGWGYLNLFNIRPEGYKLAMLTMLVEETTPGALPPYSWWWVDTLAMNLPQWIGFGQAVGAAEGNPVAAVLWETAEAQYNMTRFGTGTPATPPLFSSAHGLWFRDHTYVNATSPNGSPVFWGRGNAWAGAMLAKTLSLGALPAGHPLRTELESVVVAMGTALVPLQGADGFWRASLLDADSVPNPETTATAGITALLAFGLRTGLLSGADVEAAVEKAWAGLTTVALPAGGSGSLAPWVPGYCQPVGAAPAPATADDTSDFCTGLVLVAAAEVYRLAAGL